MADADNTPLTIRCPDCGRETTLTPRQLRSSLAAQCRKCKRDLSDITAAALRAYERKGRAVDADTERVRRGGYADKE
jgi:uncharacterized paraquat-inducible protein A